MTGVEVIRERARELPDAPGVYLFRDTDGGVLYVGKAKSLKKRVGSYARGDRALDRKTTDLILRVAEVESMLASSETEALFLEQNLIKRHRPAFNIRLRDDKSYPYIAITVGDRFPRVLFTRERHRKGVRYFGPYCERVEGARDARRAEPRVPVPPLRGPGAGPAERHPLPRLPHRPLPGALRRVHLGGGLPRPDRRRDRVPRGPQRADRARALARDARRRRGAALRGRGPRPQPVGGRAAPAGAAAGRPRRCRRRGRVRRRPGRRPRDRADPAAPRRPARRPVHLRGRERRRVVRPTSSCCWRPTSATAARPGRCRRWSACPPSSRRAR